MNSSQKIRLSFQCDQKLEDMVQVLQGNYHCQVCSRNLHDFRGWLVEEVASYTSENKGCGIFHSTQVKPEVRTILSFSGFRKSIVTFFTVFSTDLAYAQTSDTISLDQAQQVDSLQTKSNETVLYENRRQSKVGEGEQIDQKELPKKDQSNRTSKSLISRRNNYEYGLYTHKRFPFISFRKQRRMHTMGFW